MDSTTKLNWRDHFPPHPAAEIFPPLSKEDLQKLGKDIRASGILEPISLCYDENGQVRVADGRNRLDAAELEGLETVRKTDDGHYEFLSADRIYKGQRKPLSARHFQNIRRRHLTTEQLVEATAEAMRLWDEDRQTGRKSFQPVKPRGRPQEQGAVTQVSEATGKSKPTVRKNLTKIGAKKVKEGTATKAQVDKVLNKPKTNLKRSTGRPEFTKLKKSWKLEPVMTRIMKIIDQEVLRAPTDAARAEIGRELARAARVIVQDHAAIEDAEVV